MAQTGEWMTDLAIGVAAMGSVAGTGRDHRLTGDCKDGKAVGSAFSPSSGWEIIVRSAMKERSSTASRPDWARARRIGCGR
jgi:hypothetical protein